MSRYYGDYGGWPPYVPVAERRANAKREMGKLMKKGQKVEPIEIEGLKIAKSFWGKGWCDHVEAFGDLSNRLPRGRRYVRNGSVCHLQIGHGTVIAYVSGSDLYNVKVDITPLKPAAWKALKSNCTGKIGSLVELLQGQLSDEIMGVVTDPELGLFPLSREIKYSCDCPDYASMCKHIAAVIYGIGTRLDTRPELLFQLRGVDHEELITVDAAAQAITGKTNKGSRRKTLSASSLNDVFGIDLAEPEPKKTPRPKEKRTSKKRAAAKKKTRAKKPFKPSARSIKTLRKRHGLSQAALAEVLEVTPATISRWEQTKGVLKLREKSQAGLEWLHTQKPSL